MMLISGAENEGAEWCCTAFYSALTFNECPTDCCTWCHLSKLDKILMCWESVLLSSADDWCIVGQVGLGLIKPS